MSRTTGPATVGCRIVRGPLVSTTSPSSLPRPRRRALGWAAPGIAVLVALAGCSSTATPSPGASASTSSTGASGSSASAAATSVAPAGPLGSAADLAVLGGITVTGATGTEPTVTLATKPVTVSATSRTVLVPGTGPTASEGTSVQAHFSIFKGSDGSSLNSTYPDGKPESIEVVKGQLLPGLYAALQGAQAGHRILAVIPPAEAFGTDGRPDLGVSGTENLIWVIDVKGVSSRLAKAQGTPVAPVAGLPTVTFDDTTGPTITIPAGAPAPAASVNQLLIDGDGAAITAGQQVTVHYTGVLWKDGSVFDSSWPRKSPLSFTVGAGKVIKAWDQGFVGTKVGSRVMLVVAPADGYGTAGSPPKISGTDTLVFVVDILGAS